MPAPHHILLLVSLLFDGGPPGVDGGTSTANAPTSKADAGTVILPSASPPPDAGRGDSSAAGGSPSRGAIIAAGIEWPDEVHPLATLDGSAVLAAHAALQHLLARLPKELAGTCSHSAKAMEVIVGQEGGTYFVRINQRVEKCGGFAPGFNLTLDWFELYAVSPEGKVLARYPHQP